MSPPPPAVVDVPAALGRGALVRPGQLAPPALAGALRVVVDEGVLARPRTVVDQLHQAWVTRTPYVVELKVSPAALQRPATSTRPVHDHDARFLFEEDRLVHLVWANTVDHRGPEPVWWHTVKACRANPELRPGAETDVVLADGTPAWIDGGPRQPVAVPELVLHRDDTERGVLATARRAVGPIGHEQLAPDQQAAVIAVSGAVRVAAPAGSGKTRVLTSRLAEVLGSRGHPADSVLALAYNTAAAQELRQRCPVPGARTATVHAHALAVLRRHLGQIEVLDERECRGILQQLVRPPRRANVDPLRPYLDALERVRIALVAPEEVEEERDDVTDLPEVLAGYRAALAQRGAVDFPEMVYRAIEVLLRDPATRRAEQARVGEVLVDEFQDLTPAYLLFIRLLASPQLQCFGVGDDDQVIYGHAGATPDYLLHFAQLFPGAEDHPLTVNYRCPKVVVEAAVSLLAHNKVRLVKAIDAGPQAAGGEIDVRPVDSHAQSRESGRVVRALLGDGAVPDDIAVLARVRVALLGTQAELVTAGIGCRSPIGEWLLDRTAVRAGLAYLRLATEDRMGGQDLAAIMHRPLRPIPGAVKDQLRRRDWDVEGLRGLADTLPHGGARRAMRDLADDLGVLRRRAGQQPTAEVLRFVNDVIGLADVAESLDHTGEAPSPAAMGSSHFDDLQALLHVADHCPQPAGFEVFLRRVVTQPPPDGPAITLSTIHSVKGLEWDHVVLIGLVEGTSPHRLATSAANVEEERRVAHVALTRARSSLTLIVPKTGASRFVAELQGAASVLAPSAAPRPSVGTAAAPRRPPRTRRMARVRATVGLQVKGAGGLAGTVETVADEGALIRTARGSLVRIRYGDEVRVDGSLATLARP